MGYTGRGPGTIKGGKGTGSGRRGGGKRDSQVGGNREEIEKKFCNIA